ncbi:MAG TPA: hypothetical protein PK668_12440 [Myxococcota bacterium]|nr:hypothetical protein [Myxococcota bacterium]HRY93722.1 hypothetical protein [Myxococcota bacterium]HSA21928.1 hypothetical protein [Myxococcota bacterium]
MSRPPSAPSGPDRAAAFERVRKELGQGKLVDPRRLAALQLRSGERARWGDCLVVTWVVDRELERVSEPLLEEPQRAPEAASLWGPSWPPTDAKQLVDQASDQRQDWSVRSCPDCQGRGQQDCRRCAATGQVEDPKHPGQQVGCTRCDGRGTVNCPRCKAAGRLLEFARLRQRVERRRLHLKLPADAEAMPRGATTGQADFGLALGFDSVRDVEAAAASADLAASAWFPDLCRALLDRQDLGQAARGERRLGWRAASARWWDGWLLHCDAQGKAVRYFVPDSGARVVGPRLRSPLKVGIALGLAALAGLVLLALFHWSRPAVPGPGGPGLPGAVPLGPAAKGAQGERALDLERVRRLAEDPVELDTAVAAYLELAKEGPLPAEDEAVRREVHRRLGERLAREGIRLSFGVEGGRRPYALGETNLPEGSLLEVSVRDARGEKLGALRTTVRAYRFGCDPLGPPAGLPDGEFQVHVALVELGEQPEHVRAILGERGERLSGPHLRRGADGLPGVEARRTLRLPG